MAGALLGLAVLCSCLLAAPASGQWRNGGDLTFVSRYEWRGITRTSGWSLQPDVFLSYGARVTVTAGVWGNVQLSETDEEGLGLGRRHVGQWSPWVEVAGPAGPLELAAGWTAYVFEGDGAVTPARVLFGVRPRDTHEVYVRARLLSLPVLVPSLGYYHDVDAADGGYLEARLAARLPLWPQAVLPFGSLYLSATGGLDLGQDLGVSADGEARYGHFADRGLTHWDFALELPTAAEIGLGPLALAPVLEAHLELNRDPVSRVAGSSAEPRDTTLWFRLGVSAFGPRCRPEREICDR